MEVISKLVDGLFLELSSKTMKWILARYQLAECGPVSLGQSTSALP